MIKALLTKHYILIVAVAAVILVGGAVWYVTSSRSPAFGTVAATKGNVIESVDEPADVEAENSVDLSFAGAGQIANVYVAEGDAVGAGQTLATLDQSALAAGVEQAQAAVAAAEAKLDTTVNGTRPEQMQIYQSAVGSAQAGLTAAIGSAYTASDDAIHNQTDNFYTNPRSANPVLLITIADSQMTNDIESQRAALETALATWYTTQTQSVADATLKQVKAYLDAVAIAVNNATPNGAITASTLTGYKVNVVTARAEVVASINALTAAESAFTAAQNQLTLAQAGSTAQDIEVQKAAVLQAQAALATAQVALDHASIKAPFAGIVRNLTAKIGQIATPGVPVVSLTNSNGLKVTAYVSESDVAKVAAGDKAEVTLDAYGTGTFFPATVTTVDNAPTQVNGTSAYKVTLHFTAGDSTIKDGMSGNVTIVVAEHDGVIEVPSRLVVDEGSDHFILVANGGTTERRAIQVGLSGDGGMTEITSGINEGDLIANF